MNGVHLAGSSARARHGRRHFGGGSSITAAGEAAKALPPPLQCRRVCTPCISRPAASIQVPPICRRNPGTWIWGHWQGLVLVVPQIASLRERALPLEPKGVPGSDGDLKCPNHV